MNTVKRKGKYLVFDDGENLNYVKLDQITNVEYCPPDEEGAYHCLTFYYRDVFEEVEFDPEHFTREQVINIIEEAIALYH